MKTIEVLTGKTSLKDLVTMAKLETEIVLTEDLKPVAKVIRIAAQPEKQPIKSQRRRLGLHAGVWVVSADFDEPLPDEFWLGQP